MQKLTKLINKLEEIEEILLENEDLNNLVAEQGIFAHNLSDKVAELKKIETEKMKDKANKFIKEEIETYQTMENIACHNQAILLIDVITEKYNINNLQWFIEEVNRQLRGKNLKITIDEVQKGNSNDLIVRHY